MKSEKEKEKMEEEEIANPSTEKVLYDNRIKRKNVLALNEKVAAIREYEKMPVYKRIGRIFQCSPDQIKRIVQQKDSILKAWEQRTRRSQDAKTLEMKVVRVSMLGKAVYEWIRRMMYYKDFMITDGLVQKMALQFKSAMGLQKFFPHQDWVDKFRQTYNITKIDSKLLNIAYTQGFSVQTKDIIIDVLSECTPENGENDAQNETSNCQSVLDESGTYNSRLINSKKKSTEISSSNISSAMPKLQPIRQLVALPIGRSGVGLTQKVLVATPIAPPSGGVPNVSSMTMTIIPLTTIGKNSNASKAVPTKTGTNSEKQSVPPPIVEIKQEIKEEVIEVVNIKQECISDEEENMLVDTDESLSENSNDAQKQSAQTKRMETTNQITKMYNKVDCDELSLSRLRELIQKETAICPIADRNFCETSRPDMLGAQSTFSTARTFRNSPPPLHRVGSPIPILPPLTKAPKLHRINGNKGECRPDIPELSAIKTYAEARHYLKMLEEFALFKENYRLIGLVTRADEVLRELDDTEE